MFITAVLFGLRQKNPDVEADDTSSKPDVSSYDYTEDYLDDTYNEDQDNTDGDSAAPKQSETSGLSSYQLGLKPYMSTSNSPSSAVKSTNPTSKPSSSTNPTPDPDPTPPVDTLPARVCGTVGYGGDISSLASFQSRYPGQWRSDLSLAELWNVPGQTFEDFNLTTETYVMSNNVTLRNFAITGGQGYYPLRTDYREDGDGLSISNGTINLSGATDSSLYKGIVVSVPNVTINNMDISGAHDGILISSYGTTISNTCIHDLASTTSAHNDGIEIYGGGNIVIEDSEINNSNTQTSAINITNDFGPIDDVLIENVRLSGGGYTIYVRGDGVDGGAVSNIRFRNVVIDNPGVHGVISYASAPGAIVEWDVKDSDGNPIPHP